MAKAKKKTTRRKKAPSAQRKTTAMTKATRDALMKTVELTRKAEQAKADAELKVFAAKLIAHIMKEAGIKGPSWTTKKKLAARAKKKAATARKRAETKAAAAKKKLRKKVSRAKKKAGM